jgi:hypothetical protein
MLTREICPNGKNNICTLRILFSLKPERFSDNSFNAVSFNRTTNFPVNAYAEPVDTCAIVQAYQGVTVTV